MWLILISAFVRRMLGGPLRALTEGTHRLGSGDLGYQIPMQSSGELQDLANSFNTMSCQIQEAHNEINAWNRTLEERVEQKTRELSGAQEEMLRVERMASIGKLAAVVAHEINNPLAGILTYSKLLKKRLSREPQPNAENISMLDLMESESRRCGEIVKNLMTFARPTSMNMEPSDLNAVIDRCVRLVQHQLTLKSVELHLDLDPGFARGSLRSRPNRAGHSGSGYECDRRLTEWRKSFACIAKDQPTPTEFRSKFAMTVLACRAKFLPRCLNLFSPPKSTAVVWGWVWRSAGILSIAMAAELKLSSEPGHGTAFTITLPLQVTGVL